ncbi:hypothetical protein KKB40_00855 [Patescibacteria group bacterium]|nr:hypothetical protein [Patescibacteria group bacterium]
MSTLKKLLLSILATAILLPSVLIPTAHAQHWYNQDPYTWYDKVYNTDTSPAAEIFGERYTAAQVQWVIYSVLTFPFTLVFDPPLVACILGSLWGDVADVNTCTEGFIAQEMSSGKFFATVPQKPKETLVQKIFEERNFSGITYVKNKARKLNLIPEAQAQGFGFTEALNPFVEVWAVSRDIVYGLFVVTAIILAFMIMFRVKLSPQVVITVQSAIPKLVIALLLVTFSYAIAGFLIDLMYVAIGVVSLLGSVAIERILGTGVSGVDPVTIFNLLTSGDISGTALGAGGIFLIYILVFSVTLLIVMANTFAVTLAGASSVIGSIGLGLVVAPLLLTALIIILVVGIVVLIVMFFKTIWMLTKAFVNVILLTMFAPFQILAGVLDPNIGFGAWVKSFVSNLAVFVGTGLLFLFAMTFLAMALTGALQNFLALGSNPGFTLIRIMFGVDDGGSIALDTPLVGWPPLLVTSGTTTGFLYMSVSAVIFFMIPKVADIIKGFISKRPFEYGTAVGEAFGPVDNIRRGQLQSMSTKQTAKWGAITGTPGSGQVAKQRTWEAIRAMSKGNIK